MIEFFSHMSNYLPHLIIGFLLLAVTILISIATLTSKAIKTSKAPLPSSPSPGKVSAASSSAPSKPDDKAKSSDSNADSNADAAERTPSAYSNKMPPFGGWISEYLTRKGYFCVSDISLSFLRAIEFLNQRLEGRYPKYDLPWYLLIGAKGSGKTSLLEGSGLSLPVGVPDFGIMDPHPALRWWFFNRAIVLDVKGYLALNQRGTASDENGWRSIISLLGRYRARRPIDGFIITIPATELYGKDRLTAEEIHDRARTLAEKVLATQNLLGLRLPVYIIVTKSDIIPGFQNFSEEIPEANRDNMLGWSCPYTLDTAFSPMWINEAFASIREELYRLRLELLAESTKRESRDGIFVFPTELMKVRKPLGQYLIQLFRHSTYEDSLMLRGIYFTGDGGANGSPIGMQLREELEDDNTGFVANPQLRTGTFFTSPSIEEDVPSSFLDNPPKRSISFAHDLLNDKIFREIGIAYPTHYHLRSANRNLYIAKIGMASFVGIGTFGLMHAYETFSKNRDYLIPVLGRVNTMLAQVKKANLPQSNFVEFDEQVKQLINMMSHIQRTSFFSIFVPQSWFSPLQKNINSSLKISYENIILRAVYMDLLIKARDILNMRPTLQDKTNSLLLLLDPTNMPEYILFQTYAHQMDLLLKNVTKFNKLQNSPDPELLREVIQYTINIPLPTEFETYYKHFRKVLQDVPYPKIELSRYQTMAQGTLIHLYTYFLSSLLSPADPQSLVGQLQYLLNTYGDLKKESLPNLEFLRHFSQDADRAIMHLGTPGNTWIDGPFFNPGNGFADLIAHIADMPIFGKDTVQKLAEHTTSFFKRFQNDLKLLNNTLVATPLMPTADKMHLSQGLIALQKALMLLFREPFMQIIEAEKNTFPSAVPEGKVISWNTKMIEAASELAKRYDDYLLKHLDEFPLSLRETMKLAAQRHLQMSIVHYVTKAQTLLDRPFNSLYQDVAGEILRSQMNDIKNVLPKMAGLMEILNKGEAGTVFLKLRSLMGSMCLGYLELVDTLLERLEAYGFKDDSFKYWNGQSDIFMSVYHVKDQVDLRSYLDLQRQRIEQLAKGFAQPLVSFLLSDVMDGYEGDRTLLMKWRRILEQINYYEQKRPDNSITTLETFILKEASDLNLRNCFQKITLQEIQSTSGDFFLDQRIRLRRGILSSCEIHKRQKSIKFYMDLADFFNNNIRNKYPFTRLPYSKSLGEAEPDDLKTFFEMMKAAGDSPKEILEQLYQLGNDVKPCYDFLVNMEQVWEFMKYFLQPASPNIKPAFDFEVEFRMNREMEVDANQILELTFSPNEDLVLSNTSAKKVGRWSYGDPVAFSFKWPEGSGSSPYANDQPYMTVDGQTATFNFQGRWSLLLAIQAQRARGGDFGNMSDPTPNTLKFTIANGPTDRTIVFNRLTIITPPKGNAAGKALSIPSFPMEAPPLPSNVIAVAESAVLTEGKVKAYEIPDEKAKASEKATAGTPKAANAAPPADPSV